jgi:dihydrolipoamide dehydrogenase
LLQSSARYAEAKHGWASEGIVLEGEVRVDVPTMMKHKRQVVEGLTKGIDGLFRKNKIDRIVGLGSFTAPGVVAVKADDGTITEVRGKHCVIATGSDSFSLPSLVVDEDRILSSTGALSLEHAPASLLVVGGGYIGLEMGSVWARLGTKVTVVEFADRLVPAMDEEISRQLQKMLEQQGMVFQLSTKVVGSRVTDQGVAVDFQTAAGAALPEGMFERVLVSVGRRPYTDGLGLDAVGIACDERGRIPVDHHFQTSVPGIYAIGDVIAGPMLAHKAEEEGVAVMEMIAGQKPHINYGLIPGVIYTHPEVASVGQTEAEVKASGVPYRIGKFPFLANSRGRAIGETDGLVKMVVCDRTDRILGVHIIGPEAGHLIAEAVIAMEYAASAEDIARCSHAHPTLSEAVKEAALAALRRPIHM